MTSRYGGAPLCSRCEKAVYMAEQVIGPNGPWHRACLTCIECKKRLDSFALAEHEGEAYCKMCHGRRFGPKGSLINGSGAMGIGGSGGGGPKRGWTLPANNDICPRCTKPVYAAEAILGAGVKYHRLCLRCVSCSKLLDPGNMTDRDSKIYCCPCYSKEFGPKGYGYGGGAAFLTTEGAR
ncbi:5476_t:CDS:2 [Diversispora eburnea]|uniref:5476_t:CDS:1 n=1 Tax=Diversispora eburnea TaxID=1213867 RepID=A0A9N9F7L0_9GLOM|nr:5476_t:CDS:2 [Diversispora eburnea]